jgi:hypothetical protein
VPYLPFDLDAKRKAGLVAKALGVQTCTITGGLLDLWEHVWRSKRDVVSAFDLTGCFGPVPGLLEALAGAEFVEPVEGGFRVRGAGKWLLGLEGRSRGGHAAKGNLVPGAVHKKRPTRTKKSSASAEGQPKASPTPPSALDGLLQPAASSQQPKESLNLAGADAPQGSDMFSGLRTEAVASGAEPCRRNPTRRELSDALVAEYQRQRSAPYEFEGSRDGKALDGILAKAMRASPVDPIGEAVKRFRLGLTRTYGQISTLHQLDRGWNAQTGSQGPLTRSPDPPRLPLDLRPKFPDESQARLMSVNEALERQHG